MEGGEGGLREGQGRGEREERDNVRGVMAI